MPYTLAPEIALTSAPNSLLSYLEIDVAVVPLVRPVMLPPAPGVRATPFNPFKLPATVTLFPVTLSTVMLTVGVPLVPMNRIVSPTWNPAPLTPPNVR